MTRDNIPSIGRRQFLAALGATALASGLIVPASVARAQDAQAAPVKGGVLKLGIGGGSTTDNLDPRILTDWVPVNQAYMLMNGLVEIDAQNNVVPELLESWQPEEGAKVWHLKVRQGVTFHNGKVLNADDVLYSLNLHRGETTSAARSVAAPITALEKTGEYDIKLVLESGNADLPYMLSDYHFLIVPDGWSDFAKPVGTGPFVYESYEPGVRSRFTRNPNYWKPDTAWVDAVEVIVINDISARTNAMMSGQVHAINRLDFKTVDLLKRNKNLSVVQSAGGQHFNFLMDCTQAPFTDQNIRLALKHGINREQLLKTALMGYGSVGNDHPVPKTDRFFAKDLPQRPYDPEKAKFHLKQAGLDSLKVTLAASDAAFGGAVDAAAVYRQNAMAGGIQIDIKREPADGYWDNVWMKAPFCMSYWGGRPTADQMLTAAYFSKSSQNDTHWANPTFDAKLIEARALLDDAKRAEIYAELQQIVSDDGGAIIPMFGDYLDAVSNKLGGVTSHPMFNFMGARLAEKVWLKA
ncbi:ABC transporter substrate-binding protein [Paracoccus litorisediminis]|uniref:Peptide ABC transporter substrate-binding protein n=1 Tax=Paracoccus litorisediminis TaxID=2006130 RepID=A0A844HNZ8_9RHOB|nr:ABC transporter substrate-binding protein [Paracoccus litorisediminis]MTH60839.1 peptide ABC transporter substrate-binding protein [Paracoccus litorisediminis]